jgi:hypothetical protein
MSLLAWFSCAVFFICGFAIGGLWSERKIHKELDELTLEMAELERTGQLTFIEGEEDGCCGCHESREVFEKSYKALSNIPCKSEQKTMPTDVCESDNTEEQNENGLEEDKP